MAKSNYLTILTESGKGDNKFIANMLHIFISSSEKNIVLLEEAVKKNSEKEIKKNAHKMKGPSKHLGLDKIVDNLQFLENYDSSKTGSKILSKKFNTLKKELSNTISSMKKDIARIQKK